MLFIASLLTLACNVSGRQALVGRYVVPATGETWTLQDDGGCTIERTGVVHPCEWEYRQDGQGTRIVVTVTAPAGAPPAHSRRYVLAPSKWPGRPVTIPLSASTSLEKREDADAPSR